MQFMCVCVRGVRVLAGRWADALCETRARAQIAFFHLAHSHLASGQRTYRTIGDYRGDNEPTIDDRIRSSGRNESEHGNRPINWQRCRRKQITKIKIKKKTNKYVRTLWILLSMTRSSAGEIRK